MYELFQALVGAALRDADDYDASLLHGLTSHVAHATTGDSNATRVSRSFALRVFAADHSLRAAQHHNDPPEADSRKKRRFWVRKAAFSQLPSG